MQCAVGLYVWLACLMESMRQQTTDMRKCSARDSGSINQLPEDPPSVTSASTIQTHFSYSDTKILDIPLWLDRHMSPSSMFVCIFAFSLVFLCFVCGWLWHRRWTNQKVGGPIPTFTQSACLIVLGQDSYASSVWMLRNVARSLKSGSISATLLKRCFTLKVLQCLKDQNPSFYWYISNVFCSKCKVLLTINHSHWQERGKK